MRLELTGVVHERYEMGKCARTHNWRTPGVKPNTYLPDSEYSGDRHCGMNAKGSRAMTYTVKYFYIQ